MVAFNFFECLSLHRVFRLCTKDTTEFSQTEFVSTEFTYYPEILFTFGFENNALNKQLKIKHTNKISLTNASTVMHENENQLETLSTDIS